VTLELPWSWQDVPDRVNTLTKGPSARTGKVIDVDPPRPRTRRELLELSRYHQYREQVLDFLAAFEHPPQAIP
jgi:nitrate/nitrite transport system ATP-binding protein